MSSFVSKEKIFRRLFRCMIGFTSFRILTNEVFSIVGIPAVGTVLFYLFVSMLFLQALPLIFHTITFQRALLFLAWIIYCVYSARNTAMDSDIYLNYIKYILVFGSIYLLLGQVTSRYSFFAKKELYRMPGILNIVGIINYVLIGYRGEGLNGDYSMELSYANLVPALICTVILLAGDLDGRQFRSDARIRGDIRLFYIVNLLISYVLVFVGGARGPILAFGIIAILSSIYSFIRHKNRIMIALFFTIGVAVILLLLFDYNDVVSDENNRIIRLLVNNDILNTSGREHYTAAAIKGIKENLWGGTGVFNDRVYIYNRFHRSYAINSFGSYAHNIVLEMLLQFGIIIGTGIVVFIIFLIREAYSGLDKTKGQEFFWYIIGISIIPLLVSKSYIQTWEFYLMIGYLIENLRLKDRRFRVRLY